MRARGPIQPSRTPSIRAAERRRARFKGVARTASAASRACDRSDGGRQPESRHTPSGRGDLHAPAGGCRRLGRDGARGHDRPEHPRPAGGPARAVRAGQRPAHQPRRLIGPGVHGVGHRGGGGLAAALLRAGDHARGRQLHPPHVRARPRGAGPGRRDPGRVGRNVGLFQWQRRRRRIGRGAGDDRQPGDASALGAARRRRRASGRLRRVRHLRPGRACAVRRVVDGPAAARRLHGRRVEPGELPDLRRPLRRPEQSSSTFPTPTPIAPSTIRPSPISSRSSTPSS